MSITDPLAPPAWRAERLGDVLSAAARWLASPALADLSSALGGPDIRATPDDLAAIARWSQRVLDTRGGAERHEVAMATLPEDAVPLLIDAGRALGLLATRGPELRGYDLTVILGGTAVGNRLRVALAGDLDRRGVDLGTIAGLAAHRPLTASERVTGQRPAAGNSEWQNLLDEIGRVFGCDAAGRYALDDQPGEFQTALDHEFTSPAGRPVRILVAPSRSALRRADTRDSVDYLIRRVPPGHRRRALVVTSAVYAPYQFFVVAPRLLAGGTQHAELVGTATETAGDRPLLARRIAQEIHSAITAAREL